MSTEINIFKSDEEVNRILSHKDNKVNHKTIGQGSTNRVNPENKETVKRTIEEKATIGVLATLIGSTETSKLTGIPTPQVNQIKRGNSDSGAKPNPELRNELVDRLAPIRNKALDKVDLFMEILSTEKALKMKGRDLASAAKSMVEVYDKLGPKVDNPLFQAKTVVFYSPRVKEIPDYPVIEVEAS